MHRLASLACILSVVGSLSLIAEPTLAAEVNPLAEGLIASPEPGWPQWRGPRRDGISAETGLLPTWPEGGPKLLWKLENQGVGWSSPIITGQRLYITGDVGDDLVIRAYDLNAKLQWQTTNGRAWKKSYPGSRACGVISEGVLYHLNAHGRLAALQAASGKELWSLNILDRFESRNITWGLSECLLVDGPRLIVTPGGPRTMMAALDKTNGQTLWMSQPIAQNLATYCSPILFRQGGRRILASASSHSGFGVDADTGKLLWTFPHRNRNGVSASAPVYGDGSLFYVATVGPEGALYRLIAEPSQVRTERLWQNRIDTLSGGGIFIDGQVFANGCKNTNALHCIDWKTGQDRYTLNLSAAHSQWPMVSMLWADGRLYCQVEDGTVAMLKPGPDGFALAGRFRPVEVKPGDAWAHPALADGRLYVRYNQTLWCYDVKGD